MVNLFGWAFNTKESPKQQQIEQQPALSIQQQDDGAIVVSSSNYYGTYIDIDQMPQNETELITRYREMSMHSEVENAIDEIVNEAITLEEDKIVKIVLSDLPFQDGLKNKISACFNEVLDTLKFNEQAFELFRRWYIDGRMYFQVLIDKDNPQDGILDVRYIDPRKIRKVREIQKRKSKASADPSAVDGELTQTVNEYFIFSDKGFDRKSSSASGMSLSGLKISKDAIVYATSGLTDTDGTTVLSYLHRSIKPLNQLRMMEDASIIHKLARAPQRRAWYIDTGSLPRMKAEQYVHEIATKHKNRIVYDAATGQMKDDRKYMTMLEDYFLPRREGGRGTEVTNIPGDDSWNNMDSINFFLQKLYMSLRVPVNRLNPDNPFMSGRATEITRDEVKFGKFVDRLRSRFSHIFLDLLKTQLILKQVMTIEEFEQFGAKIKFDFARDNYFLEQKDNESLVSRVGVYHEMADLVGKIYSFKWIMNNVLKLSDEDIQQMRNEIEEELNDPILNPPMMPEDQQFDQQQNDPNELQQQDNSEDEVDQQNEKNNKYIMAKKTYDRLKKQKRTNPKDEHDFRSAAKIVAKKDKE